MHVFNDDNTEGILLMDAENALNSINRKVMFHMPSYSYIYISNCFLCPARLFIIGWGELLCKEGTTHGDQTSMSAYALGILPLLQFLLNFISVSELNVKEVAFAVAGKFSSINNYWSQLTSFGPKYGCFPKVSKTYLIV